MDQALEEKLESLQKEYAVKKRKLKKIQRAAKAKAHVKMKLLEQDCLAAREKPQTKEETSEVNSSPTETLKEEQSLTTCSTPNSILKGSGYNTESDNLSGALEPESLVLPDVDSIPPTPDNSCGRVTPQSGSCDSRSCKSARLTRKKSQSTEKLSKYRNRKIVTKLNTSNPQSCSSSPSLAYDSSGKSDCDKENVTGTSDINGNMMSTKLSSNVESEMDAMIYERKPDMPVDGEKKKPAKSTQEQVPEISDSTQNSISNNMKRTNNKESKNENDNKLCISEISNTKSAHLDGLGIAVHTVAESSQDSSVYSEDMFECGTEETALKRRTRKAKRRSTTGRQRQSARIAELSSQNSSSSMSQADLGFRSPPVPRGVTPRGTGGDLSLRSSRGATPRGTGGNLNPRSSPVNKKVMLSSVFQCLVDEGKRREKNDFQIPNMYLSPTENLNIADGDVPTDSLTVQPLNHESGQSESALDVSSLIPSGQSDSIKSDETGSFCPVLSTCSPSLSNKIEPEKDMVENKPATDKSSNYENPECSVGYTDDYLENSGDKSPTLFDSQPDVTIPTVYADADTSVDVGNSNVNDPGITELYTEVEEKLNTDPDCCQPQIRNMSETVLGNNQTMKDDGNIEEAYFEQAACFKVPDRDQLLAMETVTTARCGEQTETIACLCTTAFKLYSRVEGLWSCIATYTHKSVIRKKAACCLRGWHGDTGVSFVLRLSRPDFTTLTHYTYSGSSITHSLIDTVSAKGISSCALTDHRLIIAKWAGQKSLLTKYTLDVSTGQWSQFDLETCDSRIVTMATLKHVDQAVTGFTGQGVLHIWNHSCGFLLSMVDLSDVCPKDFICPMVIQEEGYLFLPLLSKKKCLEAGSIIVVNPELNTSEALTSMQAGDQLWSGCSKAVVLDEDILVAMETSGRLSVLDLYTGSLLATVDDVSVKCVATNDDALYLAHKQCVHIYRLKS